MGMVSTIFGDVEESNIDGWNIVNDYFSTLLPFYNDEEVTEIFVDRWDKIRIQKRGKNLETDASFPDERTFKQLMKQISNRLDQDFDSQNPVFHGSFPNNSRVCCLDKAVSPTGYSMTLRVARRELTPKEIVESGSITDEMMNFLNQEIQDESNLLITGNVGSGKTSLMRALGTFIERGTRVVTCEDTRELNIDTGNGLALEAPKRSEKRTGVVAATLSDLIETTLRMGPDRIWVGEIRNAAACHAFLQALDGGFRGGCASLHAASASDAIERMQYLIASGGLLNFELAGHKLRSSVDTIVHSHRDNKHGRKVREIVKVVDGKCVNAYTYNEATRLHERGAYFGY